MYTYNIVDVNRIVDGDTVDVTIDLGFSILYKTRVRLYGINTPEVRTKDLEEKKRGQAASQRLSDIIDEAEFSGYELILESTEKDKYGRYLGIIYIRKQEQQGVFFDIDVNQQLIKEGHAVPYYGGKR